MGKISEQRKNQVRVLLSEAVERKNAHVVELCQRALKDDWAALNELTQWMQANMGRKLPDKN
jgi:hypothetical protein